MYICMFVCTYVCMYVYIVPCPHQHLYGVGGRPPSNHYTSRSVALLQHSYSSLLVRIRNWFGTFGLTLNISLVKGNKYGAAEHNAERQYQWHCH